MQRVSTSIEREHHANRHQHTTAQLLTQLAMTRSKIWSCANVQSAFNETEVH